MRRALVVLGVLAMAWGARSLLLTGRHNVLATVVWMAGAVVVHDGVVGVALVGAGVGLGSMLRGPLRRPVTAGLIVLGTVTVTAIPVLGRFGAKADNPTVLDRSYLVGWVVFAVAVTVATTGWSIHAARCRRRLV